MISVPYNVKTLLHEDHCYKNIRIHFPNGERQDICNDLIVKDSVSFKESLCSQNTLKFGLCESPVFECEVVGVGNIKGATIEVSCEIECNLTAPGKVWRADLQKYVYPIPYGIFVVDSCQRQADMNHRKIVAYNNVAFRNWDVVMYEKKKKLYQSTYTPNLGYFLAANGVDLINSYSTEEEYSDWRRNAYTLKVETFSGSPSHAAVQIRVEGVAYDFYNSSPQHDFDALYRAEMNHLVNLEELQNRIASFFLADELTSIVYQEKKEKINEFCFYAFRSVVRQRIGSNPYTDIPIEENGYFYPYLNNYYTSINYAVYACIFPDYVELTRTTSTTETETINLIDISSFKAYKRKISIDNAVTSMRLTLPTFYPNSNEIDFSNYSDIQSLANSYAELLGIFGYYDRNGNTKSINIKRQFGLLPDTNLYPGHEIYPESVTGGKLLPKDYQSCWYDDEYTKPFGAVKCTFKDSNNEDVLFALYLTGFDDDTDPNTYQVYDLSDNAIIKASVWTESQIQDLCEIIAGNIEGVSYMPVDFVGRGLPYVEAGDTFEILTRSNDSITTIVLDKTTTGEQTLTDSYKSV